VCEGVLWLTFENIPEPEVWSSSSQLQFQISNLACIPGDSKNGIVIQDDHCTVDTIITREMK
jgi:hypothetical protein